MPILPKGGAARSWVKNTGPLMQTRLLRPAANRENADRGGLVRLPHVCRSFPKTCLYYPDHHAPPSRLTPSRPPHHRHRAPALGRRLRGSMIRGALPRYPSSLHARDFVRQTHSDALAASISLPEDKRAQRTASRSRQGVCCSVAQPAPQRGSRTRIELSQVFMPGSAVRRQACGKDGNHELQKNPDCGG